MNIILIPMILIPMIFIGWFYRKKQQPVADSFISDSDKIRVLRVIDDYGHDLCYDNIANYLEHHLGDPKVNFLTRKLNSPICVKFKYRNENYQIYLSGLQSTRDEHRNIIKNPKYLSGVVKHKDTEICVTQELQELHGIHRNFFHHIPDAINNITDIFKHHKGELHTFDMMGNTNIVPLKK